MFTVRWCREQACWMYQTDDSYESYPSEINLVIEKAFRDKKQCVRWEEKDGEFEVDFVRMVEAKVGSAASVVKVKREDAGAYISLAAADARLLLRIAPTSGKNLDAFVAGW